MMLASLAAIVQTELQTVPTISPILWICIIAFASFILAAMWKAFEKAGEPGWGAIIPIYNVYLMLKIGGKPWWWLLLIIFIPIVNIVLMIMMNNGISRNFGHGVGFGL